MSPRPGRRRLSSGLGGAQKLDRAEPAPDQYALACQQVSMARSDSPFRRWPATPWPNSYASHPKGLEHIVRAHTEPPGQPS
jgi:hypothetical protein